MKPVIKTILILRFALAMGYMESTAVVYLRALYYPQGFTFPLKEMAQQLVMTEFFREAATLIAADGWHPLPAAYLVDRPGCSSRY